MVVLAGVEARLPALTVQCVLAASANDSGEQVWLSVTEPCRLLNATGITTGVAPAFCGSRVICPKYCPFASVGALIVIGNVIEPPALTLRLPLLVPTMIDAPAGATVLTLSTWFAPVTFSA